MVFVFLSPLQLFLSFRSFIFLSLVSSFVFHAVIFHIIFLCRFFFGLFAAGSKCQLHDGTEGTCKNAETCMWLINNLNLRVMKYNDIKMCSFVVRAR